MLLPRSRYDEGVAILQGIYENVPAGDPQDPGTLCGPVISAKQQSRILGYIHKGVDEGATLLVGSTEHPKAVRQGILGQSNAFHRCRQLDDHRAGGDLRPGAGRHPVRGRGRRGPDRQRQPLRAGRQRDVRVAGALAGRCRRLRAGFIGLNGTAGYGADTPFGGYKASGVGRQNGIVGFDQYTEVKSVAYPGSEPLKGAAVEQLFDDLEDFGAFDDAVSGDVRDPYTGAGPAAARRARPAARHLRRCRATRRKPVFIVYRYEEVQQMLRDNETFSSSGVIAAFGPVLGERRHARHGRAGARPVARRWCQRRSRRRRWPAGRTSWSDGSATN